MKLTQVLSLAMVLAISSTSALAQGKTSKHVNSKSSSTSTSTATSDVSSKAPRQRFAFSYTSWLSGPPISDLRSEETAAARDGFTLGLSLQNQVGVRYWLTDQFSIMPVFDFEYELTDPHQTGKGVSLVYDSFIRAKYVDALSANVYGNKLSLDLEARYYVPVSEFSRENESYGSIRLAAIPGIDFPESGVSLSALTFFRYWMQSKYYQVPTAFNRVPRNTVGLPEYTFYVGPQVSYKLSKTFTAWMLYEASYTIDTLGYSSVDDPRRSNSDIQPGIDIRVANGVYITPYLNWYTNQPIDTTSINLITSITI